MNYLHQQSTQVIDVIINELVKVMTDNISNGEVSPVFDLEVTDFWKRHKIDVPDEWLSYQDAPYDSHWRSSQNTVNKESLRKDLLERSHDFRSEIMTEEAETRGQREHYLEDYND